MIKGIHLALKVKTTFGNSTPAMGSNTESVLRNLEFPLTVIISITKKKGRRTCTQKNYKAKLERLCSARLTRRDQAVKLLDLQKLQAIRTF
jgi:hypothetical protein